jgi:hypothetical protein
MSSFNFLLQVLQYLTLI